MSDTQRSQGRAQTPSRYWKWAAVVVAGAFLIGLVVAFFSVTVCDYELAQNSTAIKVCRHLEITDPPAAAAGVAVIALLGVVFGKISAFGVTVEYRMDQLENRTNELDADFQLVAMEAERARENSEDLYENLTLTQVRQPTENASAAKPKTDSLDDLIARYNEIRRTMPSGSMRTAEMDKVFNQMKTRLSNVKTFDVSTRLRSSNRGERLVVFAYLQVNPATEYRNDLINALIREDKPYGEYQAALAVERLVEADPQALNARLCQQLKDRLHELPEGIDRAVVLRRILRHCR